MQASAGQKKIVFMGTPQFAVASLAALVNAGYNVAAVVTAPDKPAGRGMQLSQSAVKQYALSKNIPVLQPQKLKAPEFNDALAAINADLYVVVAFRMLPEVVWNKPPLGTTNVHASLLPQYRGAAPINWAIINGEKETGITTFKLQHQIDTGGILLQEKIEIAEDETAGSLHDRLMALGASVLVITVAGLFAGTVLERPQTVSNEANLKHAPKIFTETCAIDWSKSTQEIYNLIRGLSPYPAAFTQLHSKQLKIYSAEKILKEHTAKPGTAEFTKKSLQFATADGWINVLELQLEGKKKMLVGDFLRGYKSAV